MIQNIKLIFYISTTFINTTPNKNFRYAPLWERTVWGAKGMGVDNITRTLYYPNNWWDSQDTYIYR